MNPEKILNGLLGSGVAGGFAGGVAGGVLSQALTGKKGRKIGKKMMKVGAVAAVGGLAYMAWKNHQDRKAGKSATATVGQEIAPPPAAAKFLPAEGDTAGREALGLTLMRAMIGAAKADGKLDGDESQKIFGRIDELGLDADDKAQVLQELSQPVDMEKIVAAATCPEMASEIYVASRLAIDVDTPAEQAYLQLLAARLGLEAGLVEELDRQVDAL